MLDNNILAHYGKIEYWEERYTRRPEPFDWYQVYSGIKDIITQKMDRENHKDNILVLGCGNSRLSEELYEEGYKTITNIDFSTKVISQMEERCGPKCKEMKWKVMDVLDMKDFNSEFNIIIDKGTLDSVLCGDNSVPNANKMINEVFRVLQSGGTYIVISYADPDHRDKYLKIKDWKEYRYDKIAKPSANVTQNLDPNENNANNFHYIYMMTKK